MSVRTGLETAAISLLAIGPLLSAGCFSPPGQGDSETEATAGEDTNAAESAPTDGGPGATSDAGTTGGGGGTTDVDPDTGNVDEDSTGSATEMTTSSTAGPSASSQVACIKAPPAPRSPRVVTAMPIRASSAWATR